MKSEGFAMDEWYNSSLQKGVQCHAGHKDTHEAAMGLGSRMILRIVFVGIIGESKEIQV